MLKQRIISSLILIPMLLVALFYGSLALLAGVVFLLVFLCGYEWLKLVPFKDWPSKVVFMLLLMGASVYIHFVYDGWLLAGIFAWAGIIAMVLGFPSSTRWWGNQPVVSLLGLVVLPLFCQSVLNILEGEGGRSLLFYLLVLVWSADIGAYMAGKKFGKNRLIPQVSPGKTWEGLAGGLILTGLSATIGFFIFQPTQPQLWAGISLVVFVMALFGDLFISILKRRCQLKDTGNLIPGHGGILDRLDSLIAASPVFYFGIQTLNAGSWTWLLR